MPLPRAISKPALPMLSFVLHRSPFKSYIGGISTLVAKALGLYSMTEQRPAKLRNGISLPVRLSDYNGRMLYLFGTPDPKIITVFRTLIEPGSVFLDIGANYGTVGLLIHRCIGEGGEIHFVEPQPELCEHIRGGIDQAGVRNASVHNCGMWDEDGELELSRPQGHTGAASVALTTDDAEKVVVPVRDIKSFLQEHVDQRPFVAKVDVEGAEPKILPTLLSDPRMRLVLFECNISSVRDHAWDLIQSKSLTFFVIKKYAFRTRLKKVQSQEELDSGHDVLAARLDPEKIPDQEIHPSKLRAYLRNGGTPT
ncbi:MAG: FkbM family methyltransferase [Phycisphaerales bacterium]